MPFRFTTRTVYEYVPEYEPDRGTDEDDLVVVPNVPLFGAMKKMKEMGQLGFQVSMMKTVLEGYDFAVDSKPFIKVSVKGQGRTIARRSQS